MGYKVHSVNGEMGEVVIDGALTGSAPAVEDSEASNIAGLVSDFNDLLAALRSRGVLADD